MTYCAAQTNLLAKAGRELAERLLPKPFTLCFSDHSTGRQMRIMAPGSTRAITVWQGSVWHSHIYEFNDRDDIPGLQPDFEFATDIVAKYFADVKAAVDERADVAAADAGRAAEAAKSERSAAVAAIREQVTS